MSTAHPSEVRERRFVLTLGPESVAGSLPLAGGQIPLDADYASFLGGDEEAKAPLAEIRLFAGEGELEGWGGARETFRSAVWRLRETPLARFVVGTAFDPPQPFWVARLGSPSGEVPVAHLASTPAVPVELVVEPALRILSRLVLMNHLFRDGSGLIVHTAAAAIEGRTYLFLGHSGAGKSTLSRLFLGRDGCEVVNDDRMILTRAADARWTAWGTPWPGELRIARRHHAPLGALAFLEKSEVTSIEPLAPREALARLLPLVSIPWYDAEVVPLALDLCGRLVSESPAHVLRFRPDESAPLAVLRLAGG